MEVKTLFFENFHIQIDSKTEKNENKNKQYKENI